MRKKEDEDDKDEDQVKSRREGWARLCARLGHIESSVPVPHFAPCVSFETLPEVCAFLENPYPQILHASTLLMFLANRKPLQSSRRWNRRPPSETQPQVAPIGSGAAGADDELATADKEDATTSGVRLPKGVVPASCPVLTQGRGRTASTQGRGQQQHHANKQPTAIPSNVVIIIIITKT